MFNIGKYLKDRYKERMREAIYLLGGKCVECGSREDLHIDHIDPKSKFKQISNLTNYSYDVFLLELQKCQLLCSKHHGIKTAIENNKSEIRHGTLSMYRYCKCDLCVQFKSDYNKLHR